MRKEYMLWTLTFTLLLSAGCAWQQGSERTAGGDRLFTYADTANNNGQTKPTAMPQGNTAGAAGILSIEEAKAKALIHAGLIGVQVTFTKNELDYENGIQVYEVEFYTQDYEYDYEINASTGEVVDFGYEKRTAGNSAIITNAPVNSGANDAAAAALDGNGTAMIAPEKAKELMLVWVPGAAEQNIWKFKTEFDNGRTEYKGKIVFDNAEYEFELDAYTGKIIEFGYEASYHALPAAGSSTITIEKAKELVLAQIPGATEQDICKVKTDYDDGRTEYEIEVIFGNAKYEFELDAFTGKIMGLSYDAEYITVPVMAVTPAASAGDTSAAAITAEEAKKLALAKVPGATMQDILEFETDYDNGRAGYEGKIVYGGIEYEFEIDCHGTFHCWETETIGYFNHHSSGHHNSGHYSGYSGYYSTAITAAEAKSLALAQVPGATARNIVEFETDYDDGRIEYEGKIIYNGMEYEFEIDGYSGAFRSWEAEPVH